jgi:hypothetical protein
LQLSAYVLICCGYGAATGSVGLFMFPGFFSTVLYLVGGAMLAMGMGLFAWSVRRGA